MCAVQYTWYTNIKKTDLIFGHRTQADIWNVGHNSSPPLTCILWKTLPYTGSGCRIGWCSSPPAGSSCQYRRWYMGGTEWPGYDTDWTPRPNMPYTWPTCSSPDSLPPVIYTTIYNGTASKALKRDCLIYLTLNAIIVWNYFVKHQ